MIHQPKSVSIQSVLDNFINEGRIVRHESQRETAARMVGEFSRLALDQRYRIETKNLIKFLEAHIVEIDHLLTAQLNEIIHDNSFQSLESTWRGLNYLVFNTEVNEFLQLRALNISKSELSKDLANAIEFDQSAIFKKVYEEEFGTFGGEPYGLLVGDYYFDKSSHDIRLLQHISSVAAAAHAPFISAASPGLFNLDNFTEIPNPRDLKKLFKSSEYIEWNALREKEDSRYLALTLPRVLLRLPYHAKNNPIHLFEFYENVRGDNHDKFLWGNASWALAERITACFTEHGWISAFRGVAGGGLIENLPTHLYRSEHGDMQIKCPSEIAISDRREKELSDLGFIALCYQKNSNRSAFFGGSSLNMPKIYEDDDATANAFLSSQLPYIFSASRFAHYVKVISREKIGGFTSRADFESYLNGWIASYVIQGDASFIQKIGHPLAEAKIQVIENVARPGTYSAVAHIRPHLQMEELATSIRLVAALPS